jgi:hypothetical protein
LTSHIAPFTHESEVQRSSEVQHRRIHYPQADGRRAQQTSANLAPIARIERVTSAGPRATLVPERTGTQGESGCTGEAPPNLPKA